MTECPWHESSRNATLTAIITASIELVDEAQSIDAVPVEAIASKAGISRRTFFNHVPGKMTALLMPLFELRSYYVANTIAAPAALDGWGALEHGISTTLETYEDLLLAARSERILTTLVHTTASSGDMPDRQADIAHQASLEASLAARLPAPDPLATALLVANGDHILRLALRAHLAGDDPHDLVRRAFSLLRFSE